MFEIAWLDKTWLDKDFNYIYKFFLFVYNSVI